MIKLAKGLLVAGAAVWPFGAGAQMPIGDGDMPAYQLDAEISVYLGGMEILKFDWQTIHKDGAYRSKSHVYPVGLVSMLFDIDVNSQAMGRIVDGVAIPQRFDSRYLEDGEEVRSVEIDFDETGPIALVSMGGEQTMPDDEILTQVGGMIDPLSAAMFNQTFVSGGQVCAGSHSIFSGDSAYTLGFEFLRETTLKKSRYTSFEGPAYICEVAGEPLAAFNEEAQERLDARSSEDKPSKLYIGRVITDDGNEFLVPVKVLVPTDFGTAVAHLTNFTISMVDEPLLAEK